MRHGWLLLLQLGCDADEDGLTNREERGLGTDPHSADTDGDGLPDAYELGIGTDPRSADSVSLAV